MVQKSGRLPVEVGSFSHDLYTFGLLDLRRCYSRTTINSYQVTKIWWISFYRSKACLAFQLSICPFLFTSIVVGSLGVGRSWETGEKKHPHMLKCDEHCFLLWLFYEFYAEASQVLNKRCLFPVNMAHWHLWQCNVSDHTHPSNTHRKIHENYPG